MAESAHTSNERLRQARLRKGWTQERLADELYKLCCEQPRVGARGDINAQMISRWENGKHPPSLFYQEKLCLLFDKSAEELGFVASLPSSVTQMPHQLPEVVQEPGITKKKQGLKETERYFDRRTIRLEKWVIDGLEDGTLLRWQLYYTSRNSLTEEGLFNRIGRLEQLADDAGIGAFRTYRVLIQNYQLAGSLARDNFHPRRAEEYFREAHQLSEEIQSPDLAATSVARHALVLLREERIEGALALYHRAAHIATHAESYVRAYVLSGLAEALARNGHRDDCYRTLDRAEQLFDRAHRTPPEEDFAQVHLTLQSLEDVRGECYVLLGEPYKGLDYLFQTWCPSWSEEVAWYETMLQLRAQGKIRAFGISVSDHRSDEANSVIAAGRVDIIEAPYSMLDQRAAERLFPIAQQHHVSIIARCPLASGALTGTWHEGMKFHRDDWRRRVFRGTLLQQTLERVARLKSFIDPTIPLAQVALRFCLSHPTVTTVIPGVRSSEQVACNLAALEQGPLSEEIVDQIVALWQDEFRSKETLKSIYLARGRAEMQALTHYLKGLWQQSRLFGENKHTGGQRRI